MPHVPEGFPTRAYRHAKGMESRPSVSPRGEGWLVHWEAGCVFESGRRRVPTNFPTLMHGRRGFGVAHRFTNLVAGAGLQTLPDAVFFVNFLPPFSAWHVSHLFGDRDPFLSWRVPLSFVFFLSSLRFFRKPIIFYFLCIFVFLTPISDLNRSRLSSRIISVILSGLTYSKFRI